jgi:hypothetical protein
VEKEEKFIVTHSSNIFGERVFRRLLKVEDYKALVSCHIYLNKA